MSIFPLPKRSWTAAVPLAVMVLVGSAARADVTTQDGYVRYHAAIRAAALCEGWKFYTKGPQDPNNAYAQDAYLKMTRVIRDKTDDTLFGRPLMLIERAKSSTGDLIQKEGCNSPKTVALLDLFHRDLQPAL